MAKDFEEKVLKKLDELSAGQKAIENNVQRLEVLHEETKDKIEKVIEIGQAQKELWEKSATKEDVYENQRDNKLTRSVVKAHSVDISDHERRIKRLESNASVA